MEKSYIRSFFQRGVPRHRCTLLTATPKATKVAACKIKEELDKLDIERKRRGTENTNVNLSRMGVGLRIIQCNRKLLPRLLHVCGNLLLRRCHARKLWTRFHLLRDHRSKRFGHGPVTGVGGVHLVQGRAVALDQEQAFSSLERAVYVCHGYAEVIGRLL